MTLIQQHAFAADSTPWSAAAWRRFGQRQPDAAVWEERSTNKGRDSHNGPKRRQAGGAPRT